MIIGRRAEKIINAETYSFREWLRSKIQNDDFYFGEDKDAYQPDVEYLYMACLLDQQAKEIDELQEKLNAVVDELQKRKNDQSINFFKEMGILDK